MKVYVGVTDRDWYVHLAGLKARLEQSGDRLDEVNFWQPGGNRHFRSLSEGELFLFKLHSPDNFIVGGGIFAANPLLPSTVAWEAFGEKNGATTFNEMQRRIIKYRDTADTRATFTIGCILLQSPFFLDRQSWAPMPVGFPLNAVQGKTYDADAPEMKAVLAAIRDAPVATVGAAKELEGPMYGEPSSIRQRLGQGTFRVMILDAYDRRCAVTGEKTLPTLEAAHILSVSAGGRHATDNGLSLRSDVHRLFDAGYVTITPDLRFRVSDRIKSEFDNGEEYYALAGSAIRLPADPGFHPRKQFLEWHADTIFLGVTMTDLEKLIADLRQFATERDWQQFHDPKNLAMLLASETGELVAEYRWIAGSDADQTSHDPEARSRIAAEIGDVGIALLLLCDRIGIDLLQAMREKLAVNRERYPVAESRGKAARPKP